jgi:hypothetical protein
MLTHTKDMKKVRASDPMAAMIHVCRSVSENSKIVDLRHVGNEKIAGTMRQTRNYKEHRKL